MSAVTWSSVLVVLTACYQLYFAVFHLRFWKRHRLDFDLRHASDFIRRIFRILSVVLAVQLTANALILLGFWDRLAASPVGMAVLLQIAAFWAARLVLHALHFGGLTARSLPWMAVFALGVVLPVASLLTAL